MSAGWNSAAGTGVQASENATSLPMLEIPGCAENQDVSEKHFRPRVRIAP